MADLPIEITLIILSKLPVQSLFRFKCVCKQWCSWISHPKFELSNNQGVGALFIPWRHETNKIRFLNQQLISSEIEINVWQQQQLRLGIGRIHNYHVLGSCGCLLLININEHIFLWNLATRVCTKVLELKILADHEWNAAGGLVFDSSKNDYKVLLFIFSCSPGYGREYAIIASLKGKMWREIDFPYDIGSLSFNDMITMHGRLHSRVGAEKPDEDRWWYYLGPKDKVIYFDVVSEKFHLFPIPKIYSGRENALVGLGVVNKCLCTTYLNDDKGLEVWIMKEYGIKESWTSLCIVRNLEIKSYQVAKPLFMRQNGELVFVVYCVMNGKVVACNLKTDSMREVLVWPQHELECERKLEYDNIITYVESLISPEEYCWSDDLHKQISSSSQSSIHSF